ncbi:TolC family protein, partial [Ramlibacter sp.]|uniref:TolC family protein n=1 Tax=Ramlibacter sp. TaxID=1917967 RepID=UPI0017E80577
MKILSLSVLAAALFAAGCATTLPPLPAPLDTPAQFKEADGARWTTVQPAEARDRGAWWQAFNDPVLERLVLRAGANNTDIAQAAARLAQARALVRQAQADRLPQLGLSAGANRQAGANTAQGTAPATLVQAGVGASWEPDLFGRLSRTRDAASLDAQSREALLQSTRLAVQAETAQTYLSLRAIDAEHALVRETVAAYDGTVRLTQRRFAAGDIAELDVVRVQAEQAGT